jgi:hypothetical protein
MMVVAIVYFAQGFKTVGSLGLSFYLKEQLHMDPSTQQALLSTAHIPWSIKPLYGILTDNMPLFGRKRQPYIIVAAALGVIGWFTLAYLVSTGTASPDPTQETIDDITVRVWGGATGQRADEAQWSEGVILAAILLTTLSTAVSDVVVDAMVAEKSGGDDGIEGKLQKVCWDAMAIGGLAGAVVGGQASKYLSTPQIFLLTSVCPCMVLCGAFLVKEAPLQPRDSPESAIQAMGVQLSRLAKVFCSPEICKPMAYIFLAQAIAPSMNTPMFFFMTDKLGFTQQFLSYASIPMWLFMMVGSHLYESRFKSMGYHLLFGSVQVMLSVCTLLNLVLVLQWNTLIGIPDAAYVIGIDGIEIVVSRLMLMPVLIISAKLCPKGIEGTLFALFMSLQNFSHTVSSWSGAILSSRLGITSTDFEMLWLGLLIKAAVGLTPLLLLQWLLPADVEAVKPPELTQAYPTKKRKSEKSN